MYLLDAFTQVVLAGVKLKEKQRSLLLLNIVNLNYKKEYTSVGGKEEKHAKSAPKKMRT